LVRELNAFVIFSVGVEKVHTRRSTVVRAVTGGDVLLEGHDVSISGDSACFVVESLDNTVFAARYAVEAQCARVARGVECDGARGSIESLELVVAPVDHEGGILSDTASICCALVRGQGRVDFGDAAGLLSDNRADDQSSGCCERDSAGHDMIESDEYVDEKQRLFTWKEALLYITYLPVDRHLPIAQILVTCD
jgi:hypothetical protein